VAVATIETERPPDDVAHRVVTLVAPSVPAIAGTVAGVPAVLALARAGLRQRDRTADTTDQQARRYEACRCSGTHARSHSVTTSHKVPEPAIDGCDDCRTIRSTHLLLDRTRDFLGRAGGGRDAGDSVVLRHR
jgi:hypothetical protein